MSAAGAGSDRRIETILVAAIGENGVIGRDNALPWRLKSDLQYFKRVTMGKPVVMGRKTYLSIGKPLPGRTNIVITRDTSFNAPGVVTASSIPQAMAIAHADAPENVLFPLSRIVPASGLDQPAVGDRHGDVQIHVRRAVADIEYPCAAA